MRISEKTLSQLPAGVSRPAYDRSKVVGSIVHLGIGAFHRAHQAMFTDAVLASGDLAWGIVGAGVISADMKNALMPQDGLYALAEMGADSEKVKVIGSIIDVLGGPEDADKLLAKMSDLSSRIVSITVTEKGYYLDLATGKLQLQAPAIAADLANPATPKTILGLIVQALKNRKAAGTLPFTVLSCDNLPNNGKLAKAAVLAFAREVDADLAAWIEANVCFPCTMVDRITPATTDADRAHITEVIGMDDAWPVVTEQFVQWVIEDQFTMGRPDWTVAGAVFSDEIECWENMKLRCLNGSHSTLSYLGQLTGRETVADAMQLPLITDILDPLWIEIREVLHAPKGVNPAEYVESLKQRYRNPALKHRTAQIACDGSQKLPQRLLAPLRDRIAKGLSSPMIATAVAAWMHFVVKTAHTPGAVLNDPMAAEILAQAQLSNDAAEIVDNLLAIEKIFGTDLPAHAGFRDALLGKFIELANNPAVATATQISNGKSMEPQADIALIGLAVMGQNLILNMDDHGFTVVAYNRSTEKVDQFLANEAKGTKVLGAHSIAEMVSKLKSPRRVMMLVKAGKPVDDFIEQLIPHLEPGDIIIDGGNSLFDDTNRRQKYVESKGLLYIGTGVSGGEEGARNGPSIMPGGSPAAWPHVKEIFQAVSAKVEDGTPCCEWVGEMGAGHYVKMVHNGIEYGDMQLICEAYNIMKTGLGMSADEMHEVFAEWNEGDLDSYLIEISRDILAKKDDDGAPLVDKILDTAGQKGTGKWTVINSQDLGIPITLMAEAVYARCVSALKDERVLASAKLVGPSPALTEIAASPELKKTFIGDIKSALYASKIVSYAQGYMLMRAAAKEYQWTLNYGGIALMWRGGCIIRSRFLGKIKDAFDKNPELTNLLLDDYFTGEIGKAQAGWRNIVATAAMKGIPVPAFSTALAFFDQYRSAVLPANLLQAQRDYFGAHTYERIDQPRGKFSHTNWTGKGGTTASSTYNV